MEDTNPYVVVVGRNHNDNDIYGPFATRKEADEFRKKVVSALKASQLQVFSRVRTLLAS